MNTIYKSILIIGVGLVSLNTSAQKKNDAELSRQVNLEREYNPTLNEASKINTAPNIFSPKIQSARDVRFVEEAPELRIKNNKLGKVASGDIQTNVPFNQQRFYLRAGAGSDGNIDGVIGVRAVDNKNDKLDITASYDAMSGNVDYADRIGSFKKAKAKYNDLKLGLNYQHQFEPSVFQFGGWYEGLGYNYYGNPFSEHITAEAINQDTKQKVDLFSFHAGLKSSAANQGLLKYAANISYTSFKTKYGLFLPPVIDKGPKGGIIEGNFDFYSGLGEGNIGMSGSILNQLFSGRDAYDVDNANFGGYTNFTVNPYYKMEGLNWNVNLGANVSFVNDDKNKLVVAPNLLAQIHINEVNTLYAEVTGGVNNNTFVDILRENRYVSLGERVKYSKTVFDINAGFRSGIIPNLEFEVFGGYKQTKDDHLYVASAVILSKEDHLSWANMGLPIYDKISTGHLGGQVKTKLIPYTTLSARLIGYFYNLKEQEKAWGKPTFTADVTADIKPFEKFTVSLQYILQTGRKGLSVGANLEALVTPPLQPESQPAFFVKRVNMNAINEFNVSAEYELLNYLSVFGRINNIFNQKYEKQLGYTMQGMNVLGGVALKF